MVPYDTAFNSTFTYVYGHLRLSLYVRKFTI